MAIKGVKINGVPYAFDYDDLEDKPTIPSKTSDLTNDSGFVTSADVPTKTSDLINDSGFITDGDIPDFPSIPKKTSDLINDSGFVTSADIPTKTSDLTNDSGFITSADVPTKTSDLTNDSGFQENVLERINVNGSPVEIVNKTASLTIGTTPQIDSAATWQWIQKDGTMYLGLVLSDDQDEQDTNE